MADLSSNLKVFLARELQRQFSSLDNSVALFIAGTDNTFTYPNISTSINSISDELKTRRQLQTAKILTDSTIALMIPRVNWTSGTIYNAYSYTLDNSSRNFYVYNSDGNVYVCISNGGGKKSLEEPSGTGTGLQYLSNGYIWKFIYRVPSELIDFVDSSYIPVREVPTYENKPFAYGSDDKQLQYAVQYTASGGVVDGINVDTVGSAYPHTVKASAGHKVRESTGSPTVVSLDLRANGTNGVYENYTLRIFSGTGAGQFRKISSYDGSSKKATVATEFTVTPDATSLYEIIPTVEITGDGSGASAYVKMHAYAAKTIDAVVVANGGTNYTFATAKITPTASPTPTVLSVSINPVGGVGKDAIFDLFAKRISILIKIEGRERQRAVLGNDYRQFGLWLSPKIGSGYTNAGKIAGTDAFIRTKVDLSATPGTTFSNDWARSNDFVFGSESFNSGKVANVPNPFTKFSSTRAQVTLDGLNSKLKNGETLYTFTRDNNTGGYTFTDRTAKVRNTLFEDSTRSSFTETYRCSHKLGVSRKDGLSFDPGLPYTSIPFDAAATGGSGSGGLVLDFTNIRGGSGDVFLTKVVSGNPNVDVGFRAGETLAVNNLELDITSVDGPELNLYSGKMLYITDIEQVTRNAEQLDLFKINFDF